MAQLMNPINIAGIDPTQSVGQFPVGKHPVVIFADEVTATKDQANGMLILNLRIIDGPNMGQEGAYRLNLYHQNQVTCQIAHKQFAAVCHAVGQPGFHNNTTESLWNIPFVIEVGLQKAPNPENYTEIKKVFDMNGNEPGKVPTNAVQQQAPSGFTQPAGNPAPAQAQAFQQAPAAQAFQQAAPAVAQWQQPAEKVQQPAFQQPDNAPAQTAQVPWGKPQ